MGFIFVVPAYTSKSVCEGKSGNGFSYMWQIPYDTTDGKAQCLVALAKPDCREAPWTR